MGHGKDVVRVSVNIIFLIVVGCGLWWGLTDFLLRYDIHGYWSQVTTVSTDQLVVQFYRVGSIGQLLEYCGAFPLTTGFVVVSYYDRHPLS